MAATTATTTRRSHTATVMLCYTVIIALIASLVLSVDAIRCHQCNSYLNSDCNALRLNTPRATRDDQFLTECEGDFSAATFCRKTVVEYEITGEHRIVRGCGFDTSDMRERKDLCFDADNEGYKQTICACFEEGCNAAPARLGSANQFVIFGVAGFAVLVASVMRRTG